MNMSMSMSNNDMSNNDMSNNDMSNNDMSNNDMSNNDMSNTIFDIVIPLGPNDKIVIHKQLEYTKKNIIGYRRIFIISYDDTLQFDGCTTISERIFPFSMETVSKLHGKNNRNGWFLQQLLKLYAGLVIPDILEQYLVVDTDTLFIKPTSFYENGKPLYSYGNEYHITYFTHMKSLHDELNKMDKNKSGICHHMVFETKYIKELFAMVEKYHDNTAAFYDIFLNCVTDNNGSGASEYEIYFNFLLSKHPDDVIVRYLPNKSVNNLINIDSLNKSINYVSCHWYSR